MKASISGARLNFDVGSLTMTGTVLDVVADPTDIVQVRVQPTIGHKRVVYIDVNGVTLVRIGQINPENIEVSTLRAEQVANALRVMVLTPHIRDYLRDNDPKALKQAREALGNG